MSVFESSVKKIKGRALIRSHTSEEWEQLGDLILDDGEIGYNNTIHLFKVGDGESEWKDLEYSESKLNIVNQESEDGVLEKGRLQYNSTDNTLKLGDGETLTVDLPDLSGYQSRSWEPPKDWFEDIPAISSIISKFNYSFKGIDPAKIKIIATDINYLPMQVSLIDYIWAMVTGSEAFIVRDSNANIFTGIQQGIVLDIESEDDITNFEDKLDCYLNGIYGIPFLHIYTKGTSLIIESKRYEVLFTGSYLPIRNEFGETLYPPTKNTFGCIPEVISLRNIFNEIVIYKFDIEDGISSWINVRQDTRIIPLAVEPSLEPPIKYWQKDYLDYTFTKGDTVVNITGELEYLGYNPLNILVNSDLAAEEGPEPLLLYAMLLPAQLYLSGDLDEGYTEDFAVYNMPLDLTKLRFKIKNGHTTYSDPGALILPYFSKDIDISTQPYLDKEGTEGVKCIINIDGVTLADIIFDNYGKLIVRSHDISGESSTPTEGVVGVGSFYEPSMKIQSNYTYTKTDPINFNDFPSNGFLGLIIPFFYDLEAWGGDDIRDSYREVISVLYKSIKESGLSSFYIDSRIYKIGAIVTSVTLEVTEINTFEFNMYVHIPLMREWKHLRITGLEDSNSDSGINENSLNIDIVDLGKESYTTTEFLENTIIGFDKDTGDPITADLKIINRSEYEYLPDINYGDGIRISGRYFPIYIATSDETQIEYDNLKQFLTAGVQSVLTELDGIGKIGTDDISYTITDKVASMTMSNVILPVNNKASKLSVKMIFTKFGGWEDKQRVYDDSETQLTAELKYLGDDPTEVLVDASGGGLNISEIPLPFISLYLAHLHTLLGNLSLSAEYNKSIDFNRLQFTLKNPNISPSDGFEFISGSSINTTLYDDGEGVQGLKCVVGLENGTIIDVIYTEDTVFTRAYSSEGRTEYLPIAESNPYYSIERYFFTGTDGNLNPVEGGTTLAATQKIVTLKKDDWIDNEQIIEFEGVEESSLIWVYPRAGSHTEYVNARIEAIDQFLDAVTFKCITVPDVDIEVKVIAAIPAGSLQTTLPDLAEVAFSGSYNDLDDKPNIPTTVAELEDAGDYAKVEDISTLADYVQIKTDQKTLLKDNWDLVFTLYYQSIEINDLTGSATVWVNPTMDSRDYFINYEIYAGSQEEGYITFYCSEIPDEDVDVIIAYTYKKSEVKES